MKGITTQFTEEVRAANAIKDVLPQLVSDFKGFEEAGDSDLKCPCPFHQSTEASFTVYVDGQSYHCFGCGRWGDVFDLVRELQGVDFVQARDILADRVGIRRSEAPDPDAALELELRAMGDILGAAADFYHRTLIQDGDLLEAVKDEFKEGEATVIEHKVGWAQGANLAQHLASRGFARELAQKLGVVREDGSDFFQNRFTIPYPIRGRVVFMIGRARKDGERPHYLDLPPNELVRRVSLSLLDPGREGDPVVVLSFGDWDVLNVWQLKCLYAPGGALPEEGLALLAGYDPIYICSGRDAWDEAVALGRRIFKATGILPSVCNISTYTRDLYEWLFSLHLSKKQFQEELRKSKDLIDSMLDHIELLRGERRASEVQELFCTMATFPEFDLPPYRRKVVHALDITRGQFAAHLEAARAERETAARLGPEDIDEGSCLAIHPALDYLEQIGVVGVAWDRVIDNRLITRPYLITSEREKLEVDGVGLELEGKRVLFRSEPRAFREKRWSKADIDKFLAGDNPDPGQTFFRLLGIVKRHIDFRDPVEAEILAIWCMGSYLFPLFTSYPYLHLYGFKGTGKTQTMRLASKLAFNMVLASGITPSATFRLVQSSRCCVGLDEAENLRGARDQDSRELLGFLRAGCKKGSAAIRAEGRPG